MGYALLLISFSKPATESALDASEILILLCGLILAIGAAGEYIEEHGTLPEWMKWSRRPKMVFVWMVALSLAGEFVGDAGVFVFSGHLQTINDGEYAALNKEAATQRLRAATLERELILSGPRKNRLTGGDRERFISLMKPFSDRASDSSRPTTAEVWVDISRPDEECRDLVKALTEALSKAEWQAIPAEKSKPFREGIDVSLSADASPRTKQAASALTKALNDLGLQGPGKGAISIHNLGAAFKDEPGRDDVIVLVGIHP
jgi:hypothetical protein